jgi:hypothetical protein
MKVKIRRGFFETNSSSSHNVCIALTRDLKIPPTVYFCFDDYGYMFGPYNDMMTKASYLYTGLYHYNYKLFFEKIIPMLEKNKIRVLYEKEEDISFDPHFAAAWFGEFFDVISEKELLLKQFLFSPRSFITGGLYGSDYKYYKNLNYEHYIYSPAGVG